MENEDIIIEETQTESDSTQSETIIEVQCVDYTEQIETLLEIENRQYHLQQGQYTLNLFTLGVVSALFVCIVLYKAIKKFI